MQSEPTARPIPASGAGVGRPGHRTALVVVLVAGFMDFLDAGIVILAAPVIRAELGASTAVVEWLVAGYTLAFAVGLITGGRLGDLLGHRRMFLIGVACFTLASAACGWAPGAGVLLAARVAQGLAAAVMVPQILSLIQLGFPADRRAGPLAAYGAMAGVANVCGPLLAGLLVSPDAADLGWRSLFLINLPIGVAVLVAGALTLPDRRPTAGTRLDLVGAFLITAALTMIMFPLVEGPQLGWPAWCWWLLAGAGPMLVVFGWYEYRRRDGFPLVPVHVFARPAFVAGLAAHLTLFAGISGFWLVFATFCQVGLGFSTLRTGLASLPWPVTLIVVAGLGVALAARHGRRVLLVGALLMVVGMAELLWVLQASADRIGAWALVPALALAGAGMALIAPSLMNLVLSAAAPEDSGAASGLLSTALQVGSALGVALIGLTFFGTLSTATQAEATRLAPRLSAEMVAAGVPPATAAEITATRIRCLGAASTEPCPPWAPSPEVADPEAVAQKVAAAESQARLRGHVTAFSAAVEYEIAVFALSLVLIAVLPARLRHTERTPAPPE